MARRPPLGSTCSFGNLDCGHSGEWLASQCSPCGQAACQQAGWLVEQGGLPPRAGGESGTARMQVQDSARQQQRRGRVNAARLLVVQLVVRLLQRLAQLLHRAEGRAHGGRRLASGLAGLPLRALGAGRS